MRPRGPGLGVRPDEAAFGTPVFTFDTPAAV